MTSLVTMKTIILLTSNNFIILGNPEFIFCKGNPKIEDYLIFKRFLEISTLPGETVLFKYLFEDETCRLPSTNQELHEILVWYSIG